MKQFLISLTGLLLLPVAAFSQGKMVKHTVLKNETVSEIAEKYNTTSYEIYRLNPDSKKGIKPDTILLIQSKQEVANKNKADKNKSVQQKSSKSAKVHTVVSGDSFYSLSKAYGVSIEDIKNANPDLKPSGLQLGTELKIPSESDLKKNDKEEKKEKVSQVEKTENNTQKEKADKEEKKEKVSQIEKTEKAAPKEKAVKAVKVDDAEKAEKAVKTVEKETVLKTENVVNETVHEVVQGDSKFSIAKKYGITIKQLQDANPGVSDNLSLGTKLKIVNTNQNLLKEGRMPEKTKKVVKTSDFSKKEPITYEVRAKETLYGLTKKFSIHPDALVAMNPELKEGVREGMILKLPGNTVIQENVEPAKPAVDLSKKIYNQDKKQLVLLLPFNLSKIEKDSVNTVASRLKADKFLSMTLDFYSGALMAIDSAKTLGMNIDVKIYDSQETRNASSVASIIQKHELDKANAVIGPFYQTNVEKAAEILSKNNVPVISPLSKDLGKSYPNLLQAMPSNTMAKNAMFDYMYSKNGNILAILDPKKISSKMYLTQNHKEVKLVGLNVKNSVVADSVSRKMVKDKINFVILDTEKTNLILNTLNVLTGLMAEYPIQLVILEKNETLDFEEIPLAKLAKLKMLYPSFTRYNETPEAYIFEKEYKTKNKIFPNQYATRGFDITFDTMLRLSQQGVFSENLENPTEQIQSQFRYEKNGDGYVNKGIYILYYDSDLSVKEAK